MGKTVVVTARIGQELSDDLDRLAALRDRSRAWLIERSVAAFVADNLDQYASLAEADAQIERGECLSHEDFMRELKVEFGTRQAA